MLQILAVHYLLYSMNKNSYFSRIEVSVSTDALFKEIFLTLLLLQKIATEEIS